MFQRRAGFSISNAGVPLTREMARCRLSAQMTKGVWASQTSSAAGEVVAQAEEQFLELRLLEIGKHAFSNKQERARA